MSAQIFADLELEADAHDRRSPAGRVAAVAIVVGGYLATVSALVMAGRWDEGSTRWLSEHRRSFFDGATAVASRSGDTLGTIALSMTGLVMLAVRTFRTAREAFR